MTKTFCDECGSEITENLFIQHDHYDGIIYPTFQASAAEWFIDLRMQYKGRWDTADICPNCLAKIMIKIARELQGEKSGKSSRSCTGGS